jgi:hypothetical protein
VIGHGGRNAYKILVWKRFEGEDVFKMKQEYLGIIGGGGCRQ